MKGNIFLKFFQIVLFTFYARDLSPNYINIQNNVQKREWFFPSSLPSFQCLIEIMYKMLLKIPQWCPLVYDVDTEKLNMEHKCLGYNLQYTLGFTDCLFQGLYVYNESPKTKTHDILRAWELPNSSKEGTENNWLSFPSGLVLTRSVFLPPS